MQGKVAYGCFTGSIDPEAVQRITARLAQFTNPQCGYGSIHLLFHSHGGEVRDGVVLHNFFQAFPLDLILYNGGQVASSAVSAFLGAKQRKTSIHATFAIHRSFMTIRDGVTATDLQQLANMMRIQDKQTAAIFRRAGLKLTDAQWTAFTNNQDLAFSADEALEVGFVQEIAEFTPPPETTLFTL